MEENIDELELSNVHEILDAYANEAQTLLKDSLEKNGRRASGALIDNLYTEVKYAGTTINVVLYVADYIKYVTEGRPPTTDGGDGSLRVRILKWIDQKGITPYPAKNGKLPTKEQLSYMITNKIHREGYEGSGDLKATIEELNNRYMDMLKNALQADFDKYSIKILDRINKMIKI